MIGQKGDLRIIQYNVWKSANKVIIEFMTQDEVRSADILAIQEPWRNPFNGEGYNPSRGPFRLIEARTAGTRVSIYLNRRFRDEDFEILKVSKDLISIAILAEEGDKRVRTTIHNGYNPPPESKSVREEPQQLVELRNAIEIRGPQILLGDFNLHHPRWRGEGIIKHRLADNLLESTDRAGLASLLSQGLITRKLVVNKGQANERVQ